MTRPGLAAATGARLPPCSASTDLQHAAAAAEHNNKHNTETHNSRPALGRGPAAWCLCGGQPHLSDVTRPGLPQAAQPRVDTLQIMPLLLPCLLRVPSRVSSHPSALSPQLPIAYSVTVTETTLLSSFKTLFQNVLFKTITPILPIAGVLSIRTKNN